MEGTKRRQMSAKAKGFWGAVIGTIVMAVFIAVFDIAMAASGSPVPAAEKSRYLGMLAVAPLYGFGYAFGYKTMLNWFAKALHFSGEITIAALMWWIFTGSKKGFIRGLIVVYVMFCTIAGMAWVPGIPAGIKVIRAEGRGKRAARSAKKAEQSAKRIAAVPGPGSTLRCFGGEYAGASFDLSDGKEIVIGRDPGRCNIVLGGAKVSRAHCVVRYSAKDGCGMVKDISENGISFLDGRRIPKNQYVKVSSGDGIRIGKNGPVFLFS